MPKGVYIRTKEHNRNISKARRGKSLSSKHIAALKKAAGSLQSRAKKSASKKGKSLSKDHIDSLKIAQNCLETRLKRSNSSKRSHNKPEVVEKHRVAAKKQWSNSEFRASVSGENSFAWQGGISFHPYSPEFNKSLKESIRERDGRVCQMPGCGKTEEENGRKLDVHHIDYDKQNCLPCNLIALCQSCNTKVNNKRDYWEAVFKEINCIWLST